MLIRIKLIFLLFSMVTLHVCFAQGTPGAIYVYNKDWSPAKNLGTATYFMHMMPENDTTYICRYYLKNGPMVKWETYRDSLLEIPHGVFAWYKQNGELDSMGYCYRGRKDKTWQYYFDDSSHAQVTEDYDHGRFLRRVNYVTRSIMLANGEKISLDKPKPTDTVPEKVFTVVQLAAQFSGGSKAGTDYLAHTIKTPDRFVLISGPGTKASVGVEFAISKEGKIADVFIFRSREWSVDTETIRVIKASPNWQPAVQNGQPVIYKHRQSITYQVNN